MKNIEEDIKILENMNDGHTFKDCDVCDNYNEKTNCCDKQKCMELQAIEHILSDYKRVLKENEYLKEKWDKDTHILRNELDLINADRLDLLQQNKELRKENNRLEEQVEYDKTHIYTPQTIALNFIPVQKIKDKIETLEKVKEKNIKRNSDTVYKDGYFTGGIDSLRELLREE